MAQNYFEKQPTETYTISVDYSDTGALPSGTALATGTVAAEKISDGTDASGTVLSGTTTTIDVGNKLAKIVVLAGDSGESYKLTFSTTLDDSSVLVDEVIMRVEDF